MILRSATMDRRVVISLIVVSMFLLMPITAIGGSTACDVSDATEYDGIPSSFDMRDVYGSTPVRDQESTPLCSSFAETAALEYLIAKNGGELEWLSPYYLAYYQYDGFGREWSGDRNEVIFSEDVPFYMSSSNPFYIAMRFLSWITTVPDSVLPPYTSEEYGSYAFDDPELEDHIVRLTGVKSVSIRDQVDDVKSMMMSGYGGALSLDVDQEYLYSIDGDVTYHSPIECGIGHSVTLVGWDDDYPKEKFWQEPGSDGAWLVKNSWGSGGTLCDGYMWISYESPTEDRVVFFDSLARESEDVLYDHCYGGYFSSSMSGYEVLDVANVFTATGNQMLTSVGLTSLSRCIVDYSIQIYTSLRDPNDPTSGTPAFLEPQTGTIELHGAYYVNLDTPVRLDEGETFSVVVKYEGDGSVEMCVNINHECPDWTNYAFIKTGASFKLDGGKWVDLGATYDYNLHIRAYAETIDDEPAGTQFIPMMIVILLVTVATSFAVRRD